MCYPFIQKPTKKPDTALVPTSKHPHDWSWYGNERDLGRTADWARERLFESGRGGVGVRVWFKRVTLNS